MALLWPCYTVSHAPMHTDTCTYSGMAGIMATARVISPPAVYREKLSYHANPWRTAGNTSGQRFPYGGTRYLSGGGKKGERKGGLSKPEIRSSVTHLRRIRHVTRWNIITDTRKNARHPRFWSFETLSDCVEN